MSIMDIFKNFSGGNSGASDTLGAAKADPSMAGNNTVPGAGTPASDGNGAKAFPAVGEGEQSPLDGYKDLWKKDDNKQQPTSLVPTMSVDPQKLLQAAQGVDFAKAISPELLKKATEGDTTALGQAISQAAQAGFAQSAAATAKIVEQALQRQSDAFHQKVFPELMKREQISNSLATNPLFEDPAVSPMLDMLKDQLSAKFPTASAGTIKAKAEDFLNHFASTIAKSQGKQMIDPASQVGSNNPYGAQKREEEDWSKFFE